MIIIGCDYHPGFQQIAWVDTETGEIQERKLMHSNGEAERFYRQLPGAVRVGLESTGNCHWFLDLLAGLGYEVWVGDAAQDQRSAGPAAEDGISGVAKVAAARKLVHRSTSPNQRRSRRRVLLWYWLAARSQELAAYV